MRFASLADLVKGGLVAKSLALACAWSLCTLVVFAYGLGLGYAGLNGMAGLDGLEMAGKSGVVTLLAAAATAGSLGSAIWLARREHPLPPRLFVLLGLLAALAVRVGYAFAIDPEWVGDYARYWQRAVEMAQSGEYAATDVYRQRALPYLVPLIHIFGPDTGSLKAGNIALLCVLQLLGYDLLRRASGHRAAQSFTLAWIGTPEPLFSALIPSHDLIGVTLTTFVFWGCQLAVSSDGHVRSRIAVPALTTFITFSLALLQIQRSTGVLMLGVLVISAASAWLIKHAFPASIAAGNRSLGRLVLVVALCVPGYVILMAAARDAGFVLNKQYESYSALRYTTPHANSLSDGTYEWMRTFHDAFSHAYTEDLGRFSDFRTTLALSDYAKSPVDRVRNLAERLEKQYQLGGSVGAYWKGAWDDAPKTMQFLLAYNRIFSCAFALLSLVALARLLTRNLLPFAVVLVLVAISSTALALVVAAENQPRYLFLVWFVGACVIGTGIARNDAERYASLTILAGRLAAVLAASIALLTGSLLLAWFALSSRYPPESGRILTDWHLRDAPGGHRDRSIDVLDTQSDVLVNVSRARHGSTKDFGPLVLVMALARPPKAGDATYASTQVCIGASQRTTLEFFLYTPYKRLGRRGAFEIELLVDGSRKWRLDLPAAKAPVLIDVANALTPGRCNEVVFVLRSYVNSDLRSWQRATRVELFFPRLVR
jgi:hypothetical protein